MLAAPPCDSDSLESALSGVLVAMHARNAVPGISVGIFAPALGRSVTATIGVSDLVRGRQLTPSDRFLAGSVGKTFFAALALRAASRGSFALDAPISRLLPAVRIAAFQWITPRMLLTHTSGIGEYDATFMTSLLDEPLRVRTTDDWLDVLRRQPPARGKAGQFRYSDLNYVVLAIVLDALEPGGAYAAIDRELLRPLGMSGTEASTRPSLDQLVTGYDGPASMFGRDDMLVDGSLIYNPQFEWGGGGFISTPSDLARWMWAFRAGRAFPDSLWPQVVARPPGVSDTSQSWRGMGVHVGRSALGAHVGHSGYMPGYVSWVRWYESLDVSIAMQANAADTVRLRDDGFDWLDSIAKRVGDRCVSPKPE
ncbi:MAG: beta-lactamase family protein [Gemmatimonadaceae bacterium]|nr:beta-lactamase family protein [Gemmatimonadaceae bacterium]